MTTRATLVVAAAIAALAAAACAAQDESIDQYPCPPGGTTLTYASFGKAFLDANCQRCHGQPDAARNGAPSDVTFATEDDVQRFRDRIFARAADDNTTMPPGPDDPPASERHELADWLACGGGR